MKRTEARYAAMTPLEMCITVCPGEFKKDRDCVNHCFEVYANAYQDMIELLQKEDKNG